MRKHVIAYLHTHWDREWYREFEIFRLRLLRVFDNILELLENNRIPSFYFDGQVSALEDYLEMRPEKTELVKKLIRYKKLFIGPFYCLIDEFLTDETCFRKNIEIGTKIAEKYGCTDFIGYLPDTFGHSKNVVDILRDYGINKCVVWRGCGDFPSEFKWCGADTINLVRGYFHDVFSMNAEIETKAELLKKELDLISEKSGNYILLPIGADHLGVECDIVEQLEQIGQLLSEDYYFTLSNPFDYFNRVEDRFNQFHWDDELRDNSKTFTLQGCYSSRLDLKRLNTECIYKLDLVSRYVNFERENKYDNLIEYAYRMLLQNQAHDSICGCSTDSVHRENKIRYEKILQIANGIIDELKFARDYSQRRLLNLSNKDFSGIVEFDSPLVLKGYDKISERRGFDSMLLANTQRIPVTEDYLPIYRYVAKVEDVKPNEDDFIMPIFSESDLYIDNNEIRNAKINLKIIDNNVYINGIRMLLIDFNDLGDSYNHGIDKDDSGKELSVFKSKIILNTSTRAILRIDFEGNWDVVSLFVTLDKHSGYIKLQYNWENSRKNHMLCTGFEMPNPITEVWSEDMNILIKRIFNPKYDERKHLPKIKGIEVTENTAPMQRGLLIDEAGNNIGIITKGLTQYKVMNNNILVPILRATGIISNPNNPSRTTPAGPPIETTDSQMIGRNTAELYVFFGNENAFHDVMNQVYNYIIS